MMKKKKKILWIILIIFIVLFIFYFSPQFPVFLHEIGIPAEDIKLTPEQCGQIGGKIVGSEETCGQYTENIGYVIGLKCSCFCCVPTDTSYCTDGILDGTETDVDCGGFCDPCEEGVGCKESEDCISGFCRQSGICAPIGTQEEQCSDEECILFTEVQMG